MVANLQLTQRQHDILQALSDGTEFPYDRAAELSDELRSLKDLAFIKERLGSKIANLPERGHLELHLSITTHGQAYLDSIQPKLNIARQKKTTQQFIQDLGNNISISLMLIPGGTFAMGSPVDELGRWDDEGPQHEVSVRPFLMGHYPVTQAQWKAIADRIDLKVNTDLEPDPSEFKGDNHPVERVSWHEAVEFCARLSRLGENRLSHLTSHTYRLPTEAEWEYACRAGTDTPFHFGETITTDLANYRGEDNESKPDEYPGHYGRGPKGVYRKATTPVNHFHPLANAFGLCDLHGNVWEWCLDHWHDNYEGAPTDGSAWLTDDETASRVLRGGSWYNNPRYCRSACRDDYNPGDRFVDIGFRVLCEAPGL
jgi:formylglycine-generating enzyme required for sulfatase activity